MTAKCLPELPLLHLEWIEPDWAGWDEVLSRAGIPMGRFVARMRQSGSTWGLGFGNTFFVAFQVAQADQGVAVGWHRLVRTSVEEGKLIRITDLEQDAPGGHYLTWNDNGPLSPGGRATARIVTEDLGRRAERLTSGLAPGASSWPRS